MISVLSNHEECTLKALTKHLYSRSHSTWTQAIMNKRIYEDLATRRREVTIWTNCFSLFHVARQWKIMKVRLLSSHNLDPNINLRTRTERDYRRNEGQHRNIRTRHIFCVCSGPWSMIFVSNAVRCTTCNTEAACPCTLRKVQCSTTSNRISPVRSNT